MTQFPFPADEKMIKHMQSRFGFGAYLGAKLPLAAFASLRIDDLMLKDVPYPCPMVGEPKIHFGLFISLHNVWQQS